MNTIISMLEASVISFKNKAAVADPVAGVTLTYGKLDIQARRIAAKLRADSIAKGDAVIIAASRGVGYIAAILGVLMAGGVYVPMSNHYPAERVAYIREDCGAKLTIDDAYIASALGCEPVAAPVETAPEDLALILYTSGSTGFPKGILHDIQSIAGMAEQYRRVSLMTSEDIYGINSPFYFVAHLIDVFGSLLAGLTAVIVPEDLRGDPHGLADFIDANRITMLFIPPKVLRYFRKKGSSLRFVIAAGERMSQIAPEGFALMNAYGMTETASLATCFMVDRAYDNTPIGKPVDDLKLYLLNDAGERCDEGEICLAGHRGRGYLNLPEQTARTFTPNPFSDIDGFDTLIHTGDLGRLLPDGNLVYVNRKDWMIKINGQRVEPGEIEAAVRRLPGIGDAVVKDFIDPSGQTWLAAYYLSDAEHDEEALRAALAGQLPDYMIPSRFVCLERFPVNASGKLDRKALAAPDLKRSGAEYVAPESERQATVAAAFAAVLGAEKVGIDDDFFALGGDSIKVIMLQKALREAGIDVPARAVFEARTPRKLAESDSQKSALAAFVGREAKAYPLTHAQMSIYLDCQTPGRETAYNNVFGLFLPADMGIRPAKLRDAVESVLNRYPILAAVTRVVDGMPSLIPTGRQIDVEIVKNDECDRNALAQRLNTPFDLESELPVRAAIYDTPEGLLLVLALHHIVCDGTTASILIGNIAAAFNGEAIAPEGMSNLTLAQYEAEHAAELEKDGEVYRRMLDGMEGDTELYADDDPSLAQLEGKLGIYGTTLFARQPELSGSLAQILSGHGVTEASLFMSAYACLLGLFGNQKNVTFFVGENGRHDPALHNTVGMLVHNVPVCAKVDEEADGASFMAGIQAAFHDLVTHDGADFAGLISEYGLHSDCFFVYQGQMLSGVELGGRSIPLEIYRADEVMAALTLHVLKQPGGDYALRFEYAAGKFTRETIERMAEVYCRVIAGLCGGGKLKDIRLVGDENIAEMDAFNATERNWPVTDVVSLFRESAAKNAERPAVIFKDETLTYAQVDDISERIAGHLRGMGIGRGSVVSVLIPRNTFMTTASLGVLKSGAAYQPLDPTYPTERLTFMMRDAGTKLLIADEALLVKVPDYSGPVLLTKDIPNLPACEPMAEGPGPEDLFILLYTSGSTGTPKGVMLEHGNIANFCAWYREFYHLDDNSRVMAYASYGFDANMMDQYPALTTGACVVIIEEEIRLDLLALEERVDRASVTHAFMTTQVGRQFYATANAPCLKYLSVGGEKLVPLPPKADGPAFFNIYGPTECTILTTAMPVERLYERVPIGKPLGNYKCYVIDEHGRRLPPLIPGELLIAGRGVGRGYLNRPDLTEKAFIPNPFDAGKDYARAYRTGDVVRLLPDGTIDFIGRNDGQVKVRGFRIELTEVEGVIREYPGITDATVQAFEDEGSGEKFIAAYVVSDEHVDVPAVNAFILERKPPYMVPSVMMQLDAIPLNQNQKVNKRALPKPRHQRAETVPPQNGVQQAIFDCIAEAVGHADFGITTSVYEAGLSSIGAIRLNVLLSKAFDVPVRTADLKENDTVEKLERFFRNAAPAEAFEIYPDYPLTKTQEGIFVESIAKPDSTIYNVPLLMEFSDTIDLERLKTAIVAAVNAHPYIKTRLFMNDDGDVRQRRMDDDLSFDESGIEVLRADSLESVRGELVKPFKLLGGRLFRIRLIVADRKYVLIEMHHIISDGTSVNILLGDIDRAYRGEVLDKETYSGYEVALNEQKLREGEHFEQARAHFARLLEGLDVDSLPVGDIRDFRPDGIGQASLLSHRVTVEDAERFCEVNRCGLNAFFTAVFGMVLARFNGMRQSAFAGIYNGRNDSRLNRTVSMLVKTLPIAADAADDRTVEEYVSAMNVQLLDSMASDVYSFAEISREYGAKADVMFIYQGSEMEPDVFCGAPARLVPLSLDTVKAPLSVFVYLKDDRVRWASEYNSGLYSAELMQGLLEALDKAAEECLTRRRLREVSMLTDGARQAIEGFNATDNPYDATRTVVDHIVSQAQRTPERTAVVYEDRRYTYAELDRLTDHLAQHLTREGIGPETVTAVLIPRCEYMAICSLGVLRAGSAYLPLDPTYPPERLNLMVKDSGAQLLITTPELNSMITEDFTGRRIMTNEIGGMQDLGIRTTAPRPEDLFIMLYTSGSTGTPKGVMLEHRNVMAFFTWYIRRTGVDENTHASSYASYGFDACMQDLYPALMRGGCVYIIPDDMRLDLNRLREYFCENDMTHAFMTTQIGRQFALMERVPSMKLLIMGGEKLVPFAPPDYLVMNGYGPSECAMGSSMYAITALEKDVPIGRPLDNLKMYVVDLRGHLLPPGATGELWIAGPQVSRGYLNRPEQTEKVYTKNPFCDDEAHARVYHTGDMVRWLPDGNLQFIGRRDGMVKIRGFRIELTEVEEVVRRFPGVTDATVAAFDDNAGGKYLAAYLVSNDKLDMEALKRFILAEKPPYMVPAVMMQLESIPYTQNQKVNRRALPMPERKTGGKEAANDMEARLCEWFAKALGLEKVYVDDDFFELGGTSISAAKIAMKCATEQIPVVYKDIFDYTTPHRLSEFVLAQKGQEPARTGGSEATEISSEHEALWEALKHNSPREVDDIRYADIGNVLVAGATGFLGIHVVKQLIDDGAQKVYCLMRKGNSLSAEQRLRATLMYYFDDPCSELIGNRLVVIEGDILDTGLYETLKDIPFDTLINCAASVKHFTSDDTSARTNFHGVENLIDICLRLDKKLIQTSTISVAGTSAMDPLPVMREDMLSFGQKLENKYTHSKWMAERAVLAAVQERGLRGKVIRLGNLMSRHKDGEFQMNFRTNGFMNHLKAFAAIGCFRVDALDMKVEYSAIDYTARAVLLLAGTPDQFTVFHANNCHTVHMANVLHAMSGEGIRIDIVDDAEFQRALDSAMQDEKRNMAVSSLIAYNSHDDTQRPVEADNAFTVKTLYRLGFAWPIVSEDYIRCSVKALLQLGFFV